MSIISFPLDILDFIFKNHLENENKFVLRRVCRIFKRVCDKTKKINTKDFILFCARNNFISLLDWCLHKGYLIPKTTQSVAIESGHIEVLEWLNKNKLLTSMNYFKLNNLKTLHWLIENSIVSEKYIVYYAIYKNDLDLFIKTHSKLIFSTYYWYYATLYDRKEIILWLYNNFIYNSNDSVDESFFTIENVKWLVDNNIFFLEGCIYTALRSKDMNLFNLILDNNRFSLSKTFILAYELSMNDDVLEKIISHMQDNEIINTIEKAIENKIQPLIQYFIKKYNPCIMNQGYLFYTIIQVFSSNDIVQYFMNDQNLNLKYIQNSLNYNSLLKNNCIEMLEYKIILDKLFENPVHNIDGILNCKSTIEHNFELINIKTLNWLHKNYPELIPKNSNYLSLRCLSFEKLQWSIKNNYVTKYKSFSIPTHLSFENCKDIVGILKYCKEEKIKLPTSIFGILMNLYDTESLNWLKQNKYKIKKNDMKFSIKNNHKNIYQWFKQKQIKTDLIYKDDVKITLY